MDFVWEVVVNAAASDIAGRIFSYVTDNFLRPSPSRGREAHRRRLELLLGSIASAVEEAQGRDITKNLNLLAQLQLLNDAMYRGRFALEFDDDIDKQSATIVGDEDVAEDSTPVIATGKRKLALRAPFNAAKCARLILRGGDVAATDKRLASVTEELLALTHDYLRDFILLVQGYPRRNKVPWPVTTTLFIDQCVFGRHMETERVVAFLVHRPTPPAGLLSALAVVGPRQVGKTTLVKHVVADERVREHFAARIKWFSMFDVLRSGGWSHQTKSDDGGPEYLAGFRRILEEEERTGVGRCLLLFEDAHFVDEQAWAALMATAKLDEGSKVIFTSGNTNLGRILRTVELVVLRPLSEEEYWYYFKAFVFGGTDPLDYPQIAAIGRVISRDPRRTFLDTRVLSPLLRANLNARFWRKLLAAIIKCYNCELHLDVLFDFLPIRATRHWDGYCWGPTSSPPNGPSSLCRTCSERQRQLPPLLLLGLIALAGLIWSEASPSNSIGRHYTWITGTASPSKKNSTCREEATPTAFF